MTDKVYLKDLAVGDFIQLDQSFSCIGAVEVMIGRAYPGGGLRFICAGENNDGATNHMLENQLESDGSLSGVVSHTPAPSA